MHIFTLLYADHWFSAIVFLLMSVIGGICLLVMRTAGLRLETDDQGSVDIALAQFFLLWGVSGLVLLSRGMNLWVVYIFGAAIAITFGSVVKRRRDRLRSR